MQFSFCPDCGASLTKKPIGDEGLVPFCESCGRPWFSFSYPCVICCVFNEPEDRVLLIRQDYVGQRYISVAGYVKQGETIEETALREVEEETGLIPVSVRFVKSYFYEKRDQLMFGFAVRVKEGDIRLSCEVDEARWFTVEEALQRLREGSIGIQLLEDYLAERTPLSE